MTKPVYLDYAAATPLDDDVLAAMSPFFSRQYYNPSSLYQSARETKAALEGARKSVAEELSARPGEIIFTAGGTEANNLAIRGVMDRFTGKKCLISAIEHESVRQPALLYESEELSVDARGTVNIGELERLLDDEVVLVGIIYASNEIGTVQQLSALSEKLKNVRIDRKKRGVKTPLFFHTDACQAAQFLNLSVNRLGVDMMTLNGGKLYGPKQSGVLYVKAGTELNPLIYGGGQEKSLRSGTENLAACVGFAAALKKSRGMQKTESDRLRAIRMHLVENLSALSNDIIFHGHPEKHLVNHVSFALPGYDNERLLMELDERGFMVATGSACSAGKSEVSHVLSALGVSDEVSRSTLRLTMGRQTTEDDVTAFLGALSAILRG